ncbi:MAG: hypothetical protein HY645_00280 [Acidobacteria bacterium]|nr:hypothetical protein [Acidobacteriota bacterium]
MFALGILEQLIALLPFERGIGLGVIDPKADLFLGALFLLQKRLEQLARQDPQAAKELRRRIVIYDFSARSAVSSYNILARWPDAEADFFAANRADLLLDLLSGSDKLSLGGAALLQKALLLLSEFHLPITYLERLLHEDDLRLRLLDQCQNSSVKNFFFRQFPRIPKPTVAAVSRRMEALFSSEGVRLALSGNAAPDFRKLQDEANIVLINCFGRNIARGVRRLLQGLVLSDIRQGIFARQKRDHCFLWLADEAQNFFITEKLRDNITDVLTMARSYGQKFWHAFSISYSEHVHGSWRPSASQSASHEYPLVILHERRARRLRIPETLPSGYRQKTKAAARPFFRKKFLFSDGGAGHGA